MSFAIIETGGKQYKISEGETISVEKLGNHKEGEKVTFDKVLLLEDGGAISVGAPYLSGKTIEVSFEKNIKGKKVTVIRYRQKSRYFKKRGHRQPYSRVTIGKIGTSSISKKETKPTAATKKTTKNPDSIGDFKEVNKAPKKKAPIRTPKSRHTNKEEHTTMERKESPKRK